MFSTMQISCSRRSRARWLTACSTRMSTALRPRTFDAVMHVCTQREKPYITMMSVNSKSLSVRERSGCGFAEYALACASVGGADDLLRDGRGVCARVFVGDVGRVIGGTPV